MFVHRGAEFLSPQCQVYRDEAVETETHEHDSGESGILEVGEEHDADAEALADGRAEVEHPRARDGVRVREQTRLVCFGLFGDISGGTNLPVAH